MTRIFAAVTRTAAALLLATLPASAAPAAQEELSREFQKTVSLGAGQSVRIENKFGEVKVHGESGRGVKILAKIHVQGDDRARAQSLLDKIQINVEQTSQGLRIATVYPDAHSVHVDRLTVQRTARRARSIAKALRKMRVAVSVSAYLSSSSSRAKVTSVTSLLASGSPARRSQRKSTMT